MSYSWPGNIRELRNFCKFIIINEHNITNSTILKHLNHKQDGGRVVHEQPHLSLIRGHSLKESVAEFEREYLLHYLLQNNWKVSQTARQIGVERTTLYKKMKQLEISSFIEESE